MIWVFFFLFLAANKAQGNATDSQPRHGAVAPARPPPRWPGGGFRASPRRARGCLRHPRPGPARPGPPPLPGRPALPERGGRSSSPRAALRASCGATRPGGRRAAAPQSGPGVTAPRRRAPRSRAGDRAPGLPRGGFPLPARSGVAPASTDRAAGVQAHASARPRGLRRGGARVPRRARPGAACSTEPAGTASPGPCARLPVRDDQR